MTSTLSSHAAHRSRLPYVAAAAAAILGALYFVPSASATGEHSPAAAVRQATTSEQQLADTGSIDTTPYVVGGTVFLGMGAALLINAGRRSRAQAAAEAADDEGAEAARQT